MQWYPFIKFGKIYALILIFYSSYLNIYINCRERNWIIFPFIALFSARIKHLNFIFKANHTIIFFSHSHLIFNLGVVNTPFRLFLLICWFKMTKYSHLYISVRLKLNYSQVKHTNCFTICSSIREINVAFTK